MTKQRLTDEEIEALRTQHGEIAALETPLGTAVFRAPTAEEYLDGFQKQAAGGAAGLSVAAELACKCVVHPDGPTFSQWIARKPGIPRATADVLSRLAGLEPNVAGAIDEEADQVSVWTSNGILVFKTPDERQWREYQKMPRGRDTHEAFAYLTTACIVSPPRAEFQALIARKPGVAATCVEHIHRLAGMDENERLKV